MLAADWWGDVGWLKVLLYAVFIVFWIISEGVSRFRRSERRRSYETAIRPYPGAQATTARRVERDLIELPGPPCPARVRFFHHILGEGRMRRRREYTEFLAEPEWRGGALRISTPEWRGGLDRFYGGRDLQIGDAPFDERFVIQSNPSEVARQVLDDVMRDRIRRLDAMGDGPFLLQTRVRQVLIRVSSRMQEGEQLHRFIDECYGVVSAVAGDRSAGLEVQGVAVGAEAECQVCGTAIELAKRVLCRKCRTPHHADCWAYNDGCSTFACGERRSVRG